MYGFSYSCTGGQAQCQLSALPPCQPVGCLPPSSANSRQRVTLRQTLFALPPLLPQALTNGLTHSLHVLLLLGPGCAKAQAAAAAALGRCGAGIMQQEVASLAAHLADVAAVGEAVFEPWYEAVTADLM